MFPCAKPTQPVKPIISPEINPKTKPPAVAVPSRNNVNIPKLSVERWHYSAQGCVAGGRYLSERCDFQHTASASASTYASQTEQSQSQTDQKNKTTQTNQTHSNSQNGSIKIKLTRNRITGALGLATPPPKKIKKINPAEISVRSLLEHADNLVESNCGLDNKLQGGEEAGKAGLCFQPEKGTLCLFYSLDPYQWSNSPFMSHEEKAEPGSCLRDSRSWHGGARVAYGCLVAKWTLQKFKEIPERVIKTARSDAERENETDENDVANRIGLEMARYLVERYGHENGSHENKI